MLRAIALALRVLMLRAIALALRTRLRGIRWLRGFSLTAQPPLLCEEGNIPSHNKLAKIQADPLPIISTRSFPSTT
jgi:hypothetical protein